MAAFGMPGFGGGVGGMMGAARLPQVFDEEYNCYSFAFQDKAHLEGSDKIFLPPSALDTLARLHIDYPMLFQITCKASGRKTHCGVLEFSAAEGSCYLPYWMMQNLLLEEGGFLQVKNVSLPKATFVKFRPQSVDFLDISNPRAVLERALRSFSCVTVGDQICIPHNDKFYYIEVREVKPKDAACIIETDCNVDFEPPVGYQEPTAGGKAGGGSMDSAQSSFGSVVKPRPLSAKGGYADEQEAAEEARKQAARAAFVGKGARLDGKAAAPAAAGSSASIDGSSSLGGNGGGLSSSLSSAASAQTPVLGRTISGQRAAAGGSSLLSREGSALSAGGAAPMEGVTAPGGSGSGGATVGPKKPPALAGKWSQTKTSFQSFSGAGNKLS